MLPVRPRGTQEILAYGDADHRSTEGHRERRALTALCRRLAEERPLDLSVDDGHWSDIPSLEWIVQLVGAAQEFPIAIIVAARPFQTGHVGENAAYSGRIKTSLECSSSTCDLCRLMECVSLSNAPWVWAAMHSSRLAALRRVVTHFCWGSSFDPSTTMA